MARWSIAFITIAALAACSDSAAPPDAGQLDRGTIVFLEAGPDLPDSAVDAPLVVDQDGDTFLSDVDCNDNDASIFPGAPEIIGDGIDQDCDTRDVLVLASTTQQTLTSMAVSISGNIIATAFVALHPSGNRDLGIRPVATTALLSTMGTATLGVAAGGSDPLDPMVPQIAHDGASFRVAWRHRKPGENGRVRAREFTINPFAAAGPSVDIATDVEGPSVPHIAYEPTSQRWAYTWASKASGQPDTTLHLRLEGGAQPADQASIDVAPMITRPHLTAAMSSIVVSWARQGPTDREVVAQRFDPLAPIAPNSTVIADPVGDEDGVRAAGTSTNFVVAWRNTDTSASVRGRHADIGPQQELIPAGAVQQLSGAGPDPSAMQLVSCNNTYHLVYAQGGEIKRHSFTDLAALGPAIPVHTLPMAPAAIAVACQNQLLAVTWIDNPGETAALRVIEL